MVKRTVKKYLTGGKTYAAFMDLEKVYDRDEWNALWDMLRIYGVGEQLLDCVKALYRGANVCVRVDGGLSESFSIHMDVKQGCVIPLWLFNIYGWSDKRYESKIWESRC